MSGCKRLEVQTEDQTPQKWSVALSEDMFRKFFSEGNNPTVHNVFGEGSLFSPLLFGKFFDPSDAFPLWEFESDILLSNLRSSGSTTVDWLQTDQDYILKAEVPGKSTVQVCVGNAKVVEISGQWKQQQQQQRESKTKDWRCGHWWEHGFVRRIELPEDADWREIEVYVTNEVVMEIRIAKKNSSESCSSHGNDETSKNSGSM